MKGKFYRNFGSISRSSLIKQKLFSDHILPDINNKKIFPAIREDFMDFYYRGGRLFQYNGKEFITHIKYASVVPKIKADYVAESQLSSYKHLSDFSMGYNRIKENCSLYSGIESIGASMIYHNYPFTNSSSEIVVLDIEVSLKSLSAKQDHSPSENMYEDIEDMLDSNLQDRKQDRIDVLLFNTKDLELKFVELKHYSNKEIWSDVNRTPKVCSQIKRYEDQIEASGKDIIREYGKYIDSVNDLFSLSLSRPRDICNNVTLLLFGFDEDQKKGRLNKLISNHPSYKNIKLYPKGEIKTMSLDTLWKV